MHYYNILFMTLSIIITMSLIFLRLSHPLAVGLTLLLQTTLISITSGISNKTFWFSYILFLIFLGGMLVLFIYVASLASNEQFHFNNSTLIMSITFVFILSYILIMIDPMMINNKIFIPFSSIMCMFKSELTFNMTSSIYNSPTVPFTLFIIMYLLLTLIVIVKIMTIFSSPLRMSN